MSTCREVETSTRKSVSSGADFDVSTMLSDEEVEGAEVPEPDEAEAAVGDEEMAEDAEADAPQGA